MAVGQGNNESVFSYMALGRETTFGTGVTATAILEHLSSGLKVTQGKKILEQVARRRVHAENIQMGKTIEGEAEAYFFPESTACAWILQNGMGGAITSQTATGETAGGAAYEHIVDIGNVLEQTYSSFTVATRKGDTTSGKTFEYTGLRVGELSFTAEIDEALKFSSSFVGKDFTSAGTDVESFLTTSCFDGLSFVNGRVSIEESFASLTSSSFWHVQSVNLAVSNSLKNGNESRRIGSDTLEVLPPGMATISLTLGVRFDTTTAIDAMLNNTQLSCELEFQDSTLAGSAVKKGLKLQMPKLFIEEAGDPEIGGPDEQLLSELTFQVLHDCSSAGGFSLRSILTNLVANYN